MIDCRDQRSFCKKINVCSVKKVTLNVKKVYIKYSLSFTTEQDRGPHKLFTDILEKLPEKKTAEEQKIKGLAGRTFNYL